jgi:hypothetical protein
MSLIVPSPFFYKKKPPHRSWYGEEGIPPCLQHQAERTTNILHGFEIQHDKNPGVPSISCAVLAVKACCWLYCPAVRYYPTVFLPGIYPGTPSSRPQKVRAGNSVSARSIHLCSFPDFAAHKALPKGLQQVRTGVGGDLEGPGSKLSE